MAIIQPERTRITNAASQAVSPPGRLSGFWPAPGLPDPEDLNRLPAGAFVNTSEVACSFAGSTPSSSRYYSGSTLSPGSQASSGEGCTDGDAGYALHPRLQTHGAQLSLGSASHEAGSCIPCAFYCFRKQGCGKGSSCSYCHLDHISNKKVRQQDWRKKQQKQSRKQKQHAVGSEDEVECTRASVQSLQLASAPVPGLLPAQDSEPSALVKLRTGGEHSLLAIAEGRQGRGVGSQSPRAARVEMPELLPAQHLPTLLEAGSRSRRLQDSEPSALVKLRTGGEHSLLAIAEGRQGPWRAFDTDAPSRQVVRGYVQGCNPSEPLPGLPAQHSPTLLEAGSRHRRMQDSEPGAPVKLRTGGEHSLRGYAQGCNPSEPCYISVSPWGCKLVT